MQHSIFKQKLKEFTPQHYLAIYVAFMINFLVIHSGGFKEEFLYTTSFINFAIYLIYCFRYKQFQFSFSTLQILLFTIASLIYNFFNGIILTSILNFTLIMCLIGLVFIVSLFDKKGKKILYRYIIYFGIVTVFYSYLVYIGIINVNLGTWGHRLMSPFKYANTSGLWFGILTLLCWCQNKKIYYIISILPISTLILTQSIGASIVTIVSLSILTIYFWVHKQLPIQIKILVPIVFSLIIIAGLIVFLFFHNSRLLQASQTFIERIIQIIDSWNTALKYPFGIGADCWQHYFLYYQTAQYDVQDVHSGWMQITLNGGFIGLFIFILYIKICTFLNFKDKNWISILCTFMMIFHLTFDADLVFPVIIFLLLMFLEPPKNNYLKIKINYKFKFVYTIAISIVVLFVFCCCLFFNYQNNIVKNWPNDAKKGNQIIKLNELPNYFQKDPTVRKKYAQALYDSNNFERLIEDSEVLSDDEAIIKTECFIKLNQSEKGVNILLNELNKQLYNVKFFNDSYKIIKDLNNQEYTKRYNVIVKRANEKLNIEHASWLNNQVEMPLI